MIYYWILVIIYLFFLKVIFRDIKNDKRRQRNFIIFALLPIFFLMAFRNPYSYTGDVYVREPSGSGYWAHISVSYEQKHRELTIPITLTIKRVEGGM